MSSSTRSPLAAGALTEAEGDEGRTAQSAFVGSHRLLAALVQSRAALRRLSWQDRHDWQDWRWPRPGVVRQGWGKAWKGPKGKREGGSEE